MKQIVAAGAFLFLSGSTAFGQLYVDGNQLKELCRGDPSSATSYVAGAVDTVLAATEAGFVERTFCLRPGVTAGHAADTVCQSLDAMPAIRDFSASVLVVLSLSQAYPCQ